MESLTIWSRALEEDEIQKQMMMGTRELVAVEPYYTTATTWGNIK